MKSIYLKFMMILAISAGICLGTRASVPGPVCSTEAPLMKVSDVPLDSSVTVIVRHAENFPNDSAQLLLSQLGAAILYSSPYFSRVTVRVDSNLVNIIKSYAWVTSVESSVEPVPQNDGSRMSINVDKILAPPYSTSNMYNLTGQGVNLGIWDAGPPDILNNDFAGRLTQVEPTGTSPCDGVPFHSTHVAGTMAGSGINSVNAPLGTPYRWCGMAPKANIFGWSMYTYTGTWCLGPPYTPDEMHDGVINQGIVIANNSWTYSVASNTCDLFGAYQWECPDFDKLVRDQNLTLVFAAANWRNQGVASACGHSSGYGTVTPPATSKNVITVGAISKTDDMTSFSCWGPLSDGRLKPDVVAVGQGVVSSTLPGYGNGWYYTLSGTSMAAPAVSGALALIEERYHQTHGGADAVASLLKAILMNTATDLEEPGPDYKTGYGKVNALKAVQTIDKGFYLVDTIHHSQTKDYSLSFSSPGKLKVMLAYSDKEVIMPSPPTTSPALLNDLDLQLISPSGTTICYPLTLDPANPANPAVPGPNHRDNVEQVVINIVPGTWTARVIGYNIPTAIQQFALTWNFEELDTIACDSCTPVKVTLHSGLGGSSIDPVWQLISAPSPIPTGFAGIVDNWFTWGLPQPMNYSNWISPPAPLSQTPGTYIYQAGFDVICDYGKIPQLQMCILGDSAAVYLNDNLIGYSTSQTNVTQIILNPGQYINYPGGANWLKVVLTNPVSKYPVIDVKAWICCKDTINDTIPVIECGEKKEGWTIYNRYYTYKCAQNQNCPGSEAIYRFTISPPATLGKYRVSVKSNSSNPSEKIIIAQPPLPWGSILSYQVLACGSGVYSATADLPAGTYYILIDDYTNPGSHYYNIELRCDTVPVLPECPYGKDLYSLNTGNGTSLDVFWNYWFSPATIMPTPSLWGWGPAQPSSKWISYQANPLNIDNAYIFGCSFIIPATCANPFIRFSVQGEVGDIYLNFKQIGETRSAYLPVNLANSYYLVNGNNTFFVYLRNFSPAYPGINVTGTVCCEGGPAGTGDIPKEKSYRIFPNPANEVLEIESSSIIERIVIYNSFGQTIFESVPAKEKDKIDVRNFSEGIYFVMLQTGKGCFTEKILISR